jgi:hypothetical protein
VDETKGTGYAAYAQPPDDYYFTVMSGEYMEKRGMYHILVRMPKVAQLSF